MAIASSATIVGGKQNAEAAFSGGPSEPRLAVRYTVQGLAENLLLEYVRRDGLKEY